MIIASRKVGSGEPCFIVAEASCNHEGKLAHAHDLIDAAKQAGADAVKFQLYRPEDVTANRPEWRAPPPWDAWSLWELYQRAMTPAEWLPELFAHARELELVPFASAFAPWAVEFLETLDCPAYKVASLEIGEMELIRRMAATMKPVILSTGRATAAQVEAAVRVAMHGKPLADVALLHCLAAYPAVLQDMNLRTIGLLAEAHRCVVGLSDHSRAPLVAELAVALGASILEVHLMLPRPPREAPLDEGHSLDPAEFLDMVIGVRQAEKALGVAQLGVREGEGQVEGAIRRWCYAADVPAGGEAWFLGERQNVRTLRAPLGLTADDTHEWVMRLLARDVKAGDPVLPEDFR